MRALLLFLCTLAGPGCAARPERPTELAAALRRVEKNPADGEAYLELSRYYFRQRDYLRARQYLSVAERHPQKDPEALFRLGVLVTVRAGQYDDALVRCERYLERKEDPYVRILLATILESAGDVHGAEVQRQLVLADRPGDLHQLMELGRFYQRTGRPASAGEIYRRYLSTAPQGDEAPQARAALRAHELSESLPRRTN